MADTEQSVSMVLPFTRVYAFTLRLLLSIAPSTAIAYLYHFSPPMPRLVAHGFHEVAVVVAIVLSAFVSYITWRCYRYSGERFLFWVAQGLTGFTLVYLPHGILTRMSDCNLWLFLLFGPVSRVVMVSCLFMGIMNYDRPLDDASERSGMRTFWIGVGVFLLIDLGVVLVGLSSFAADAWLRKGMEGWAISLGLVGMGVVVWRRISSPLTQMYAIAMAVFAQASFSFILAKPWDHQWWLGHAISASGFFILSYGIVQAFHSTRSFSTVYSQEEMMRRLENANEELMRLATEDPLTGAANRRHFLRRCDEELARARRNGSRLSLLMIDFDLFKMVNDRYGHQGGDTALTTFVARSGKTLRGADLIGRFGGEEFVVLLPESSSAQAVVVAERIREGMEQPIALSGATSVRVTVSIGVAEFGTDGDTVENLTHVADGRLYRAKEAGRNRVVST